jgi:hypothetical protein
MSLSQYGGVDSPADCEEDVFLGGSGCLNDDDEEDVVGGSGLVVIVE